MKSPLFLLLALISLPAFAEDDFLDEGDQAAFNQCVNQCIKGSSECNEPDMDAKGRPLPITPGGVRRCCQTVCADKK